LRYSVIRGVSSMADCAATYAGRADGTEDSAPDPCVFDSVVFGRLGPPAR
jgi:hypothetical protein